MSTTKQDTVPTDMMKVNKDQVQLKSYPPVQ